MVTNAHRVEVEVGADGLASAPLSKAAAAAPPAGACWYDIMIGEDGMVYGPLIEDSAPHNVKEFFRVVRESIESGSLKMPTMLVPSTVIDSHNEDMKQMFLNAAVGCLL
jgi:hypothetical protein